MLKKCSACSPSGLDAFCADIMSRMVDYVEQADTSNLGEDTKEVLDSFVDGVRSAQVDWNAWKSASAEFVRVVDEIAEEGDYLDAGIAEFLDALDYWSEVRGSSSPAAAATVSELMMNILDYHYYDSDNYSDSNWSTVPEIEEELNLQIQFLEKNT